MRWVLIFICVSVTLFLSITAYSAKLDDFNGPELSKIWTLRDPAKNSTISFANGKLVMKLKANSDMWVKGVDAGVMLLMDPPKLDNFSIELVENPAVGGKQPPSCHVGIVFFNEKEWAYSAWGPYNGGQDIRLEDCIGSDYRWRDQSKVGINPNQVAIDSDVYLKVTKTGNKLEFFAKGSEGEKWVSGGVDEKLGPKYTAGNYKVGIIAKSWGGSVESTFEFDSFDIPEVSVTSVSPYSKLVSTWSAIKKF